MFDFVTLNFAKTIQLESSGTTTSNSLRVEKKLKMEMFLNCYCQ